MIKAIVLGSILVVAAALIPLYLLRWYMRRTFARSKGAIGGTYMMRLKENGRRAFQRGITRY